jgi:hypothetical protein
MNGMRTKGIDFDIPKISKKESKEDLPLARLYEGFFSTSAFVRKKSDSNNEQTSKDQSEIIQGYLPVIFKDGEIYKYVSFYGGLTDDYNDAYIQESVEDAQTIAEKNVPEGPYTYETIPVNGLNEMIKDQLTYAPRASKKHASNVDNMAEAIMQGKEFVDTGFGKKRKQGIIEMLTNENYPASEITEALLNGKSKLSTSWGDKTSTGVEDMINRARSEKNSSKKQAVIYDGYSYRVTIESKAGNNNQTYAMVTNMLSAADIRYREVRRYTVDPDRVMLDILITEDDVEIIKELDKEGKQYGISFTFNDNISEELRPREIVTPEKEVSEKVASSQKTATVNVTKEDVYTDFETYPAVTRKNK